MKHTVPLDKEALLFSTYLIGESPTTKQIALYTQSVPKAANGSTYTAAVHHSFLLPYLDAYDALFRPASELRQRLYLMFSILEASPEHTELFLPQQRSWWYVLRFVAYGIRGSYRLVIGVAIVKARGW
ncbi:MAG TPA: hypothetical protein VMB52_02840 [Verrucomicrobiae bacterium]|nr:hypothetical protein [Verrucomicrobiae bacterium]